jgi:hypothetical protein
MKRAVIFCSIFFAANSMFAQVGKQFPEMQGELLDGKTLTLPTTTGKKTLVGLAYSSKAEDALKSWYQPMHDKFIAKKGMFDDQIDIETYFVAMYIGLKQTAYEATIKKLKESNRKDLYGHLLFYKGELEPYENTLKLEDKSLPYFFLLDEKGKIIHVMSGNFTEKKLEQLEEKL